MTTDHEQELYWIEAYWQWIWGRTQVEEGAKREGHDEKFFEKKINRISGGPPPRGKPKPLIVKSEPTAEQTATLHRAISIRHR